MQERLYTLHLGGTDYTPSLFNIGKEVITSFATGRFMSCTNGDHRIIGNLYQLKNKEKAIQMLASPDKDTRDYCMELIKNNNI